MATCSSKGLTVSPHGLHTQVPGPVLVLEHRLGMEGSDVSQQWSAVQQPPEVPQGFDPSSPVRVMVRVRARIPWQGHTHTPGPLNSNYGVTHSGLFARRVLMCCNGDRTHDTCQGSQTSALCQQWKSHTEDSPQPELCRLCHVQHELRRDLCGRADPT